MHFLMDYLQTFAPSSWQDFQESWKTIPVLSLIETLLSVDNGLLVASLIALLPHAKQLSARRVGMGLSFGIRLVMLAFASFLMHSLTAILFGGAFLCYKACKHLSMTHDEEEEEKAHATFWSVVFQIALINIAFSIDNVVAAASFSPKMWVVFAGVSVGMIGLYFLTAPMIRLVEKFPVLNTLAYVLVGYVGVAIFLEHVGGIHISETEKGIHIVAILAAGLLYSKLSFLHPVCQPVFNGCVWVMGWIAWTCVLPIQIGKSLWRAV